METFTVDVIKNNIPARFIKVNPETGAEKFLDMEIKIGNKVHHST